VASELQDKTCGPGQMVVPAEGGRGESCSTSGHERGEGFKTTRWECKNRRGYSALVRGSSIVQLDVRKNKTLKPTQPSRSS